MTGTEFLAEDAPPRTEPRFWLRRCNGAGPGTLITVVEASFCAHQAGAVGDLETGLRWTVRGTQDPRQSERTFTLAPLTDAQAAAWIRANRQARA